MALFVAVNFPGAEHRFGCATALGILWKPVTRKPTLEPKTANRAAISNRKFRDRSGQIDFREARCGVRRIGIS